MHEHGGLVDRRVGVEPVGKVLRDQRGIAENTAIRGHPADPILQRARQVTVISVANGLNTLQMPSIRRS